MEFKFLSDRNQSPLLPPFFWGGGFWESKETEFNQTGSLFIVTFQTFLAIEILLLWTVGNNLYIPLFLDFLNNPTEICKAQINKNGYIAIDSYYLQTDLLILPCDLITDISLHNIANLHRTHDASLTMLLSPLPAQFYEAGAPGARSKKQLGKR